MASVVRIKRKWNQEPLEAIFISSKRKKTEDEAQKDNILTLIGTVKSTDNKEEVEYALRRSAKEKTKLISKVKDKVITKLREEVKSKSSQSRFKLINTLREIKPSASDSEAVKIREEKIDIDICNLYDAIDASEKKEVTSSCSDPITLNGEVMKSETVLKDSNGESYVYDLYYTDKELTDFTTDRLISIYPFNHDDLIFDGYRDEDTSDNCSDEDDSNDESNWRNDYPDEDYDPDNCKVYDYDDDLCHMTERMAFHDSDKSSEDESEAYGYRKPNAGVGSKENSDSDEDENYDQTYDEWKDNRIKELDDDST